MPPNPVDPTTTMPPNPVDEPGSTTTSAPECTEMISTVVRPTIMYDSATDTITSHINIVDGDKFVMNGGYILEITDGLTIQLPSGANIMINDNKLQYTYLLKTDILSLNDSFSILNGCKGTTYEIQM